MVSLSRLAPRVSLSLAFAAAMASAVPAAAQSFNFSTGNTDGKMATASRPDGGGASEIETADDFILNEGVLVRQASFTGLLPAQADISDVAEVTVEIYREFPFDSQLPPDNRVPTRNNSPSDNALLVRESTAKDGDSKLTFELEVLARSFTATNSVLNGISVAAGGDGSVSGQLVRFDVAFPQSITLAPGHYFFVPQVRLTNGNFYWLSAAKPILAPGTPFIGDLQTWIRNEALAPDWLRVGGDIVGGIAFNGTFSLHGSLLRSAD